MEKIKFEIYGSKRDVGLRLFKNHLGEVESIIFHGGNGDQFFLKTRDISVIYSVERFTAINPVGMEYMSYPIHLHLMNGQLIELDVSHEFLENVCDYDDACEHFRTLLFDFLLMASLGVDRLVQLIEEAKEILDTENESEVLENGTL